MISLLLHPLTLLLAALIFLASALLLAIRWRHLPPSARGVLLLLALLCLLYFLFLLWLILGFGRGPLREPTPIPGG